MIKDLCTVKNADTLGKNDMRRALYLAQIVKIGNTWKRFNMDYIYGVAQYPDGNQKLFSCQVKDIQDIEDMKREDFAGAEVEYVEVPEEFCDVFDQYNEIITKFPYLIHFGINETNVDEVIESTITNPPCEAAPLRFFYEALIKLSIVHDYVFSAFPFTDKVLVSDCIKKTENAIKTARHPIEKTYLEFALGLLVHIKQVDLRTGKL